jgi:hypothetical protein
MMPFGTNPGAGARGAYGLPQHGTSGPPVFDFLAWLRTGDAEHHKKAAEFMFDAIGEQ